MYRRSFLLGTGALALSQLLAGCNTNDKLTLRVKVLKGSIPAQLVSQFRQTLTQPADLQFTPIEQLQTLFQQLETWQKKPPSDNQAGLRSPLSFISNNQSNIYNLTTLGDYWLATAIQQKLIQPLEPGKLKQWSSLDDKWKTLVTRNDKGEIDPQGRVWGAPYRWGSTVIVYRRDKLEELGWEPRDWQDLWRTELRDRISLLDHPREIIGLTLKKLGRSYNTPDLSTVPNLELELNNLHQNVKFYSSDTYLQPLIIGDTWLAVGWSTDIAPILQRYPQLGAVIPQSGTSIWADLWVRPTQEVKNTLAEQWIDFCWQPNPAQQISILTKGTSPITTKLTESDFQAPLRSLLLNKPEILAKSEFLLPLPTDAIQQYEALFSKIKSYQSLVKGQGLKVKG